MSKEPDENCETLGLTLPLLHKPDSRSTGPLTSLASGRYQIRYLLGQGGQKEVYLARDTRLERDVVVALLKTDQLEDNGVTRLAREARALGRLGDHHNIVTIHDIGDEGGRPYIVSQYVEGGSVADLLKKADMRPLRLDQVLRIAIQICEALVHTHGHGIVHRDLKPANIWLTQDGTVKLGDFGLASARDFSSLTVEGSLVGTVTYMPPERALGSPAQLRSDLYSLGVILYEMATGRPPFLGDQLVAVVSQHISTPPVAPSLHNPEIPEELENLILRLLAKLPEDRPESAGAVQKALESIASSAPDGLTPQAGREQTAFSGLTGQGASTISRRKDPSPRRRRLRKAINSLAVLPLKNEGADANVEYLSDGITESIINTLSQLPRLRVMAMSTVLRYKTREVEPQEVGRDLSVRAVLTGRVLQLGNRLVIKTELVDLADGSQLWGEQYNRQLSDIFAVQEEIAKEISEKLRLRLTSEEKKRLTKRHTQNTGAYQFYLKGRYYWNKRTPEGFEKGIDFLERAIEEDPSYALAHAGLADCYSLLARYGGLPPKVAFPRAKAAAIRSLEADNSLAEAHASVAYVRAYHDWDWLGAEREYNRAIELNPNYATGHHWYGIYLATRGRHDEALAEMKHAQNLDPLSLAITTDVGMVFYYARRFDEAIEQYRKVLDMDPNFARARGGLALPYEQKGMYEEAIAELQEAGRLDDSPIILSLLGQAYAVSGNESDAQRILGQLNEISKRRYVEPYFIAEFYAALGEHDKAFQELEKAYEQRSSWMVDLKVEPKFDALRFDRRFADLLRRVSPTLGVG